MNLLLYFYGNPEYYGIVNRPLLGRPYKSSTFREEERPTVPRPKYGLMVLRRRVTSSACPPPPRGTDATPPEGPAVDSVVQTEAYKTQALGEGGAVGLALLTRRSKTVEL